MYSGLVFGFFAPVFLVEDVGGRCGSGRVFTFIRCGVVFVGMGRRDVVPVAAREYRTRNGGKARIELTALGVDFRERATTDWAGAGQKDTGL